MGFTISLGVVERHTGVSIDNTAHLGGVLCGLLFAAPMVPRIGSPRPLFSRKRLRMAMGMVVGILVLFGFYSGSIAALRRSCYLVAVAANFFTMASSSLRSLSFKFVE